MLSFFIFPHISVRIFFLFFLSFLELLCKQMGLNFSERDTHTHTLPTIVSVEQTILSRLSSRLGLGAGSSIFAFVIPFFLFFEKKTTCVCVCRLKEREKERAHNWKRGWLYLSLCDSTEMLYLMRIFRSCLLHHFC
jgi:hypothetical protein